ncbi:hypothetical protein DL96DRAFT_1554876 [Flagelloscypha sp. PMI_526]|nr:hypothetical protein DL96DRAFT_1554876 [Flagelloscypha sp. PMI_526]
MSTFGDSTGAYYLFVLLGFLIFIFLLVLLAVLGPRSNALSRPSKSLELQENVEIYDTFFSITKQFSNVGDIDKPFAATRHGSSLVVGVFLAMPDNQAHLCDIAVLEAELVPLGNGKG